ncbi:hypothetical protein M3638_02850 [Oceanobacillus profundus]|uniref:hypothetical protein n=1 Tax=Oceanobacillus profundus TaxID=372463 RepID=UPI00203B8488|nr:hypothetical protein [Oceanobacillus profundus]MCM3396777.1 hypothetical protein [Oceanobacillus profundus]
MKLTIKIIQIARVVSFLENTDFKGLKSVNRSKVTNYLGQKLDEVAEGEKTILEDFKDDQEKREKELKAYYEETVVVEGSNYLKPLNIIKAKIKELTSEECEQEFSGNDAYALSVLYEAFGLDQEGGEEQ